ncbi:hypothetical protein JXA48_03415 [Candidatus Woesearchaeota archaeon]|nr:hypothetical protein [Candidatus Woesearchaeota archaeon]
MTYEPTYAPGQIMVYFKGNPEPDFAKQFGKQIGYELFPKKYLVGDVYIFKTKEGEEQKAINKFQSFDEFVDWSSLRDLKFEERELSLEQAIQQLLSLRTSFELDDAVYSSRVEEIKKLF